MKEHILWQERDKMPAHLWPTKVNCECGAAVEKVGVKAPSGHVVWVCKNGHDDVADQVGRGS